MCSGKKKNATIHGVFIEAATDNPRTSYFLHLPFLVGADGVPAKKRRDARLPILSTSNGGQAGQRTWRVGPPKGESWRAGNQRPTNFFLYPFTFLLAKWALLGSNQRPYACEAYALNQLSPVPFACGERERDPRPVLKVSFDFVSLTLDGTGLSASLVSCFHVGAAGVEPATLRV